MFFRSLLLLTLSAAPVFAQDICVSPDEQAVLDEKLASYADVVSDVNCDQPANGAQQLICLSEELGPLAQADSQAWVYATENATGTESDHASPPRDTDFIATRDACADESCICDALKGHINDALGGLSPFGG